MSLSWSVKSDGTLEQIVANLQKFPQWWPVVVREYFPPLGERVSEIMRQVVEPHRYTGALSDSITSEYNDGDQSVSIFPTAMRGQYDAGQILELGTRPIPNAPYGPIAAWADFKGLPAFPVWWKIRNEGVNAYPFLQDTLDAADEHIHETMRRMLSQLADDILTGAGKTGI